MHELSQHFTRLGITGAAHDFLLMIWQSIQLFDDIADGDKVDRSDLDSVIWTSLVGMHQNPFFFNHSARLIPVMECCILKWQASDIAERKGEHTSTSFVWRASYYDLVLMVARIVHGEAKAKEISADIMHIYGESAGDYIKEFDHA
jgi:hypothetical protein